MAEETKPELTEPPPPPPPQDMDLEPDTAVAAKRAREEEEQLENENDDASKKQQKLEDNNESEKSVEEERLEKEKDEKPGPVGVGPKVFGSAVEMFDYFYKLLHHWPPYVDLNKYESLVLLDLLKKGHSEPDKKIGGGIKAFQIRNHPMWKSRCYFVIREDDSVDDFSFRKCVDHILPLPEDMKIKPNANKALGGGRGRGGRGGGRGRGGRGRR